MAKKTNKTSHVLNLITGAPPSAQSPEEEAQSAGDVGASSGIGQSSSTGQPADSAGTPSETVQPAGGVSAPSGKVTVVDAREEGKLAEEIQKNLIRELEKEQAEEPKAEVEESEAELEESKAEPEEPKAEPEEPKAEPKELQKAEPEQPQAAEPEQPQKVEPEQPQKEEPEPSQTAEPEQPQKEEPGQPQKAEQPKVEVETPKAQPEQAKYRVVNIMEEILTPELILDMMKNNGTCCCSRCQADVKALMLTRLQPKYVVADCTAVPMLLTYYRNKFRVAILSQSIRVCMEVKNHPRH